MIRNAPFKPKRSLGQNFLVNDRIAEKIIDACAVLSSDTVLEIGPGTGALTHTLSRRCQNVIAVEKDKKLAGQLQRDFEHSNVRVLHADILKFPLETLPRHTKVIGNLPYNIAAPIIKKIIDYRNRFEELYITVQLEFAKRLAAVPNTKDYGSLSCFVQFHAQPKILFRIKSSAFRPQPKVQSCFLRLRLLKKPNHEVKNKDLLFQIIRACFGQRRKTIMNSLASVMGKNKTRHLLQTCQIDPKQRAENLSLKDYVRIANSAGRMFEKKE